MKPTLVEAADEQEAMDIMSHYFRSYDMLALQAVECGDSVRFDEMCGKRDAAYREYVRVSGIEGKPALLAIIQPSGLI